MPGQRPPGFDRLVIRVEPGREASYGVHRTCGGALPPGIEAFRLPLADEAPALLREGKRLSDLGLLPTPCGERLGLRLGALRLAPQAHPGGSAWGQRRARGLRYRWQSLSWATVPGRPTLGLA